MSIFILLILFQFKHFIADYPLQGSYMLQKFRADRGFILPLAAHCFVHSILTIFICLFFVDSILSIKLAIFDFVIHFIMDRIKASPNMLGRFKALSAKEFPTATKEQKIQNKFFWWALGLDQMVHHLTHYAIIYFIVTPSPG